MTKEEIDIPFFAKSRLCKGEQIWNGHKVHERVSDIRAWFCLYQQPLSHHTPRGDAPFLKLMRRYKKSILRGVTLLMYSIKSFWLILFGMFLIITVVRVSSPSTMRCTLNWFFVAPSEDVLGEPGAARPPYLLWPLE